MGSEIRFLQCEMEAQIHFVLHERSLHVSDDDILHKVTAEAHTALAGYTPTMTH